MKKGFFYRAAFVLGILVGFQVMGAFAQYGRENEIPTFAQRNLSGPRLGITYAPGNSQIVKDLKGKKMGTVLSQFGWHFEYQVIPEGGGPSFVVQFVPMIAAVEYGTVVPSGSLAMGIRFPGGFEFGLGPNVLAVGGKKVANTALLIALGKSFNYGGVSIPLNLVCATSPDGNRFSFIIGYAITRSVRHPEQKGIDRSKGIRE